MYNKEELGFILYNNRSVNGVVSNFIPDINPLHLIRIEDLFEKCKSIFINDDKMVEVNINELDIYKDDIIVNKSDIVSLTSLILENIGILNQNEFDYLENRGIGEDTIIKWKILGLSNIKDKRHLEIIGATRHPILNKIMEDGIEDGGIIIPLFDDDNNFSNCAIRKIKSSKSLKYSLACPDIPVWGLGINKGEEIWITEGIFDMMALYKLGKNAVSCSSAMWSGIQLYYILEKKPSNIVIFSDNDSVGLRTSAILKEFFTRMNIPSKVVISKVAKDPAEHYFQKHQGLDNIVEIDVTDNIINDYKDDRFNLIEYLKNRKF